jgi:acetylornithine deacetylase/succinyl-diaminopimelate desuccinylase-like protein
MSDEKELVQLITDLIAYKTVYPDQTALANCVTFIKQFFTSSGLHIKEYCWNGNPSLVIANHDTTDFDIIFCGHIDVVPAPAPLFTLKQDGDLLRGRGVADMKGQVAVMMQLMQKVAQRKNNKKIALFLTSDEERGGFDGTNKLLQKGYTSSVAVVPDGGFNYNLVVEEKGVLQLKVTAQGIGCHSSEPWNGTNAFLKLFAAYNHLITQFPLPQDPTIWKTSCNLAHIEGGDSLNKVPSSASMSLDIRHIYDDKAETIINYLKAFDPTLDIQIIAQGSAFKVNPNDPLLQKYTSLCEKITGTKINRINYAAASDGRFFTEKNIPCIIMNPIGGNIHCDDEWVSLSSLGLLEEIYKQYVLNF